jgi:hypothetical protein
LPEVAEFDVEVAQVLAQQVMLANLEQQQWEVWLHRRLQALQS